MGTLHLVATPIGNLEDITLRAIRILGEVDLLLAEDTRHTRILLERHGIAAKPMSLHAHNEAARVERVLAALGEGRDVALVSDAGTPLVSDPGGRLVAAVVEAGHTVVPVPGASALLAAVTASGLPAERFTFLGFLPRRKGERDALLRELAPRRETLVFFESPRRVSGALAALAEALGPRPACLCRELSKVHEEFARGTLDELSRRFENGTRGELTLVVSGAPVVCREWTDGDIDAHILADSRPEESVRDVASRVAADLGLPRKRVYARVVALRETD